MIRALLYISGLCFLIVLATWSYQVNYETRRNIDKSEKLKLSVEAKKEYLSVLKAEWSYLNRPQRLESLVEKYFETLRLIPLRSDHYADVSMINFFSDIDLDIEAEPVSVPELEKEKIGLDD